MARPPIGCSSCMIVGYEDDGRYWTKDYHGARWVIYPQPSMPGLWAGYTDQYDSGGHITPPMSEKMVQDYIGTYASMNKPHAPLNEYDPNFDGLPYKPISSTPVFGPPAPPAGWTSPPGTTIPNTPGAPPSAPGIPSTSPVPTTEKKRDLLIPLMIGGVAVGLVVATLNAK